MSCASCFRHLVGRGPPSPRLSRPGLPASPRVCWSCVEAMYLFLHSTVFPRPGKRGWLSRRDSGVALCRLTCLGLVQSSAVSRSKGSPENRLWRVCSTSAQGLTSRCLTIEQIWGVPRCPYSWVKGAVGGCQEASFLVLAQPQSVGA